MAGNLRRYLAGFAWCAAWPTVRSWCTSAARSTAISAKSGRCALKVAGSFERLPGDGRRLTSGQQPAPRGGSQRQAGQDGDQVGGRDMAECAVEAAVSPGGDGQVGECGAAHRAEQAEGTGGDRGDRAAGAAPGPDGGEGAQVAGGLGADQADGRGQHTEREEDGG